MRGNVPAAAACRSRPKRSALCLAAALLLLPTPAGARFEPINHTVAGAWNGVAPCMGKAAGDFNTLRSQLLERGYDPFGATTPMTQPWALSELTQVVQAFTDLPDSMFPLDEHQTRVLLHQHTHMRMAARPQERHFKVAARAGEGLEGILIDTGWHEVGAHERRAILVHEIAHEFTRTRGRQINWIDVWGEMMKADAELAAVSGGTSLPSAYGGVSIDEDFAESFTAYRYAHQMLKRRAPNRYALLRVWAFDELEYHAASRCAPKMARSARVRARAWRSLAHHSPAPSETARIARRCGGTADPLQCARKGVFIEAYKRAWDAEPSPHRAASLAALNALMRNEDFVRQGLEEAPDDVRAHISRLASAALR